MQTAPLFTGAVITAPVSVFPEIQASDIFHRLRPILRSLSRRLAENRPELRGDYFQEGTLAVLAAVAAYDADKGSLDHYATRCARGRMLNLRRWVRSREREVTAGSLIELDVEHEQNSDALDTRERLIHADAAESRA